MTKPKRFPVLWQHRREISREFTAMGLPRSVPWEFAEPARRQAETKEVIDAAVERKRRGV